MASRQPEVPGVPGLYFAATVTRVAALLLDTVLIAVIGGLVGGVIGGIVGAASRGGSAPGWLQSMAGLVGVLVSYLYFGLLWRSAAKATVGQRVFRMQVGNAFDGATLTWRQATVRWASLFGLSILTALPVLAVLGGFAAFVWAIVLFLTTARSATKQGVHDRWANSAVVATGRQNTALAWGCLVAYIVGVVLAFVVLALVLGLIFLGSQVRTELGGQVEFGTTKPNGCDIFASSTQFPAGATVYWTAYFRDRIPAGTSLVIELTKDGQPAGTQDYVAGGEDCLATTDPSSPLEPGTYTLSILQDSTLQASGSMSVK